MSEAPAIHYQHGVVVPDTRLHPIYLVIETAKTVRSAVPFLVVTILGGAPWWVNTILVVMIMVIAIAQWHVKKYSVISGVLRLHSGLVNRSVRVVPITRITALEAYRSLTQRLVGVWGLKVQSPGDRNGSAVVLGCLSGSRLDQLRTALETGRSPEVTQPGQPEHDHEPSTIQRYLAWRRTSSLKHAPDVIAVLSTRDMLIATISNNTIPLIFAGALVVWFRFSEYVPSKAADFMQENVEPRGIVAVLVALVVIAIVSGVILGALRLTRFTLTRDGDVLRNSRGLLGKQSATIPVNRIQAVRIVEGFWRMLIGYCILQVEVAGIGPANTNQRMLFPLLKTARAEAFIRRALPELPWPTEPLLQIPQRVHRRYLTLPLEYGAGFTLLFLLLPGWWKWLAVLPLPLGLALGLARPREARWQVDDHSVLFRWRRLTTRNTVIAYRTGVQSTEWSSSPWKARAHVAGFKMRFSSGRIAKIRYMAEDDALMLLHVIGRRDPGLDDPVAPVPLSSVAGPPPAVRAAAAAR
jgi:putative membrane protein